jgi:hypothetical protein
VILCMGRPASPFIVEGEGGLQAREVKGERRKRRKRKTKRRGGLRRRFSSSSRRSHWSCGGWRCAPSLGLVRHWSNTRSRSTQTRRLISRQGLERSNSRWRRGLYGHQAAYCRPIPLRGPSWVPKCNTLGVIALNNSPKHVMSIISM